MSVAATYGVDPPELLHWHATVEHHAVGPASPYNTAYAKALDTAGQCLTLDEVARRRHGLPCRAVVAAAERQQRLPARRSR